MFPMSLKRLGSYTSESGGSVTLYISDSTDVGYIDDHIKICLRGDVKISGKSLLDLQMLQTVELPDDLERIGSCWF